MANTISRFCFSLLLSVALAHPAGATPSPVGLWRSYDDRTGQARGLIRVYEQDGILHGRVEEVLVAADRGRVCNRCTDDRRDQPILGMEIFRDLRPEGDGWAGHILDPQTGSIYTCTVHLAEGGRALVLRGYLLITLIGRSQTWQRVDAASP
jgi:uncharacterized protein (DUF2147 family)